MTQLFEPKTGRFIPLMDEQIGALTEAQAAAYNDLREAVDALTEADAEVIREREHLNGAVEVLAVAQRNAPKFDASAAHTRLVKEMIAANRPDL